MGSFRFLLAFAVLLSNAGLMIWDYNQGVIAVISFFLISGYVMTILINEHYSTPGRATAFYLDRGARLIPQYILYFIATQLLISTTQVYSPFIGDCDTFKLGLNAAILPLNLFQFDALDLKRCMLFPQGWSLALEICFYLVAPFVVRNDTLARVAAAGSIGFFLVAYLGGVNTDTYGYRLLPGTLFIFLAGASLADKNLLGRLFPWSVWTGAITLFSILQFDYNLLSASYNKEVLLGLIVGIPAVYFLRTVKNSAYDALLGNLSYAIFLNHFFCMWFVQFVLKIEPSRIEYLLLLVALSTTLAGVSYAIVERPALHWRRAFRYSSAGAPAAACAE